MGLTPELVKEEQKNATTADRVMVTYYTDPLCCWSWAIEPHWKKLREEFRGSIDWKYIMCGMLQDWQTYNDPMNAITKPVQFGPVWMHASQVSGVAIDFSIWHRDPPESSFPASLAVKCAMLQSPLAGELLLYDLREAVMTKGLNIAREPVIFSIARQLAENQPDVLDLGQFQLAWSGSEATDAFREDLQKARFLKIGRYPTFTFTNRSSKGIIITGYRPYEVLKEALGQMIDVPNKKSPSEKTSS